MSLAFAQKNSPGFSFANFFQWCVGGSATQDEADKATAQNAGGAEAAVVTSDVNKQDGKTTVHEHPEVEKRENGNVQTEHPNLSGIESGTEGNVADSGTEGNTAKSERRKSESDANAVVATLSAQRTISTSEVKSLSAVQSGANNVLFVATCNLDLEFDARKCEVHVKLVSLTEMAQQVLGLVKLEHRDLIKMSVVLLPFKSKRTSGSRVISKKVIFGDKFTFSDIQPNQLSLLGLRLRAYHCRRHRRSTMIAESTLPFLSVRFRDVVPVQVALEARMTAAELDSMQKSPTTRKNVVTSFANSVFDSLEPAVAMVTGDVPPGAISPRSTVMTTATAPSAVTALTAALTEATARNNVNAAAEVMSHSSAMLMTSVASSFGHTRRAGELLLGLSYLPQSGRLNVSVIQASYLTASDILSPTQLRKLSKEKRAGRLEQALAKEAPDTLVEVVLATPSEGITARSRTSVRKRLTDPLYHEDFTYEVPERSLDELTITVTVYNDKKHAAQPVLGWVAFGKQNSGVDEATHWNDMRSNRGQPLVRWHTLLK